MKEVTQDQFMINYLNRINLKNLPSLDLSGLKSIIEAHIQYIPFEYDWDSARKSNNLDLKNLFSKIIVLQSGGYCYETNLLFNYFLKYIGFNTQLVAGQIYRNGILDPNSVHLAIIVYMKNTWLVDISWNGGIPEPVVLEKGEQLIRSRTYKINKTRSGITLLEKKNCWKEVYYINANHDPLKLIEQKHAFHQFDSRSEFYKKRILIYSKHGRRKR